MNFPNFFLRIFQIFFQFFFPNFFVKIFLKIVSGFISRGSREKHACCEHPTRDFSRDMNEKIFFPRIFFKFFFPNFFVKIFLKIVLGFISRGSRATHACCEHPTRDFSRDYMNEKIFFPRIFSKIFFQFFFPNFIVKIFLKIVLGFISRDSRETHACCENPTPDFSCDYMNEKIFFPQNFFQDFFLKNS